MAVNGRTSVPWMIDGKKLALQYKFLSNYKSIQDAHLNVYEYL